MPFRIALILTAPLLASLPSPALAGVSEPVPPAVVARDADGSVTIRAIRLTEPLTVDGRLDDCLYRDTRPIDEFIQQEPREGDAATEKTEVWVAYDEDAVYVGMRLWESDPSRRVMSDMRRDANNLYHNDHFAVMLDTFYDRRNGYLFYANAQGGIGDAQVANENANTDWNAIWEAKTADFDGGWTIEFRLPFRSFRFHEGARMWGINFRRMVRWKTEASLGTWLLESGEQPAHLHAVAAHVCLRPGAVSVPYRFDLDQRSRPLGIQTRQRALRCVQRRAQHAQPRHSRCAEPQLRGEGDTPVSAVMRWACANRRGGGFVARV